MAQPYSVLKKRLEDRASTRGPVSVFEKGRVYVRHPGLAPEGIPLHEGPRGGLYYEADKQTEDKILFQYSRNAWDMASGDEKVALRQYTDAAYRYLNHFLRRGELPSEFGESNEKYVEKVKTITALLKQIAHRNPLPMSLELYRTMKRGALRTFRDLGVGEEFVDYGFVSTSPFQTDTYADSEPGQSVNLKINAPQGIPAIGVGDGHDNEIILPPGLTYKVKGTSFDPVDGYSLELDIVGYDPLATDTHSLINQYDEYADRHVRLLKQAAEVLPGFRFSTTKGGSTQIVVDSFDIQSRKANVTVNPGSLNEKRAKMGLGAILSYVDISEDGPFRLQQLFPEFDIVQMFGRNKPERLSSPLDKARKIYVSSPQEVPPGVEVKTGPRGGMYYEGEEEDAARGDFSFLDRLPVIRENYMMYLREGSSPASGAPDIFTKEEIAWYKSLNEDHDDAVGSYAGIGFDDLTALLEGEYEPGDSPIGSPEGERKFVEFMTSTIDSLMVPSSEDYVLYRHVKAPSTMTAGEVTRRKAYTSTTTDRGIAEKFGRGWVLEIHAPKGTPMLPIGGLERERVLPRNVPLRVVSIDNESMTAVLEIVGDGFLSKAKVYIHHPSEAPEGADIKQGPRGGMYYENVAPSVQPSDERAFEGEQREVNAPISKQEAGALGEAIVVSYLKSLGLDDARPLNSRKANFPVDLVQDHGVIEVKTGLVSNGRSAQQWRATIGQPGRAESEWLKTLSRDQKREWNEKKNADILQRKQEAMEQISQEIGAPMKGKTITVILDPDKRTADLYEFDGFHLRIGWNTPEAQNAFIGSFSYA